MKKIIFIICILCCSCSPIYTLNGDITTYSNDGKVIKQWTNVEIQNGVGGQTISSSFKSFGLNFYDKETQNFVIMGNAVPYIVEYKTKYLKTETKPQSASYIERNEQKQKLFENWKILTRREKELKDKLKGCKRGSDEYEALRVQYKGVVQQKEYIAYKLETQFFYDIYLRGVE